ncbi:acyl-CoA dehydrogenase family protein [Aquisalimonas lutea]|uniref:acyl-CoA dehydrogenase family protein n=1 Tax=Aquisalimonas lutea TaxID=1327750 RepID=UPI0025B39C3F|nr:acyl-CoA dehydrogenase family protein [Aquisalimonas lutea]MDN3516542.1 acyl-CoA dehydrogenase family protein [Aquisalimonas lutea]
MTDWNAMSDEAFRQAVRADLEANYPEHLRYPSRRLRWQEVREWYLDRAARGWTAPGWPQAFGGVGLTPAKQLIYIEEQERRGVARGPDQGVVMVGPLLIRYGTEAQQQAFLPRILSWEHIWCQGYSEPNAGSDLASLRTRAVADGDVYIVNGQKTWTTLAQDATHMFLLARTDPAAERKQEGISFLLVDLRTEGVHIRPIRNIAGHEEFCEVFLEDVRVPRENLVGSPNEGWSMAKALLGFERLFLGSPKLARQALGRLHRLAAARELYRDPGFMDQLARLELDVADLGEAYEGFAEQVRAGQPLGADVSWLKIWATETFDRIAALIVASAGSAAAIPGPQSFGDRSVDVLNLYFDAMPATIYGGSNEIQRNILAKQVLRLPE